MINPAFDISRFQAVLKLRGVTAVKVASKAGVSVQHLTRGLRGERPISQHVLDLVRKVLGDDGWDFATEQTDTITARKK